MINNRIIIAVGNAILPYLRDNLTDVELGTAAHDAVAALKAVEKSTDTSPRPQSETGGGAPWITCKVCNGSGFAGQGTGYGDVCPECGGQSKAYPEEFADHLLQSAFERGARAMRDKIERWLEGNSFLRENDQIQLADAVRALSLPKEPTP